MTSITKSDDLRASNRHKVIKMIRRNANVSRTVLSETTGLSAATLSAISNDFIAEGVLLESNVDLSPDASPGKLRRGRPRRHLALNPDAALVATVTLTLNEIGVTLINYAGSVIFSHNTHLSIRKLKRAQISTQVIRSVEKALRNSGLTDVPLMHIAVAFQGVTDVNDGSLLWSPIIDHVRIPLKSLLENHFAVPVTVGNDCSMIAHALFTQMHEELGGTFAALLFSQGVGMGIFHADKLISGARSSATEFGHMLHRADGAQCRCGKYGCIEAYTSDYAILRRARGINVREAPADDTNFADIQALMTHARNHEGPERTAFVEAGHAIGTGLGNLFALLDSFPVALIGPITEAFDLMEKPIREGIQHGIRGTENISVPILCFSNEREMINEGCAQVALDSVDISGVSSKRGLNA